MKTVCGSLYKAKSMSEFQSFVAHSLAAKLCKKQSAEDEVLTLMYPYSLTDFLEIHPGGANVILKHAGKDVT